MEHFNLTHVEECLKVRWEGDKVFYQASEEERLELSPESLVSMNFWGFHPSIFEESRQQFIEFVQKHGDNPKSEFFIPLVIQTMIDEKKTRVKVIPNDEFWYGVTYQKDKPVVQKAFAKLIEADKYPAALWG